MQEHGSRFPSLAAGWVRVGLALLWLAWLPTAHALRPSSPLPPIVQPHDTFLTSPLETRVGGCEPIPSGRLFSEGFLRLEIATGCDEFAYEIVPGRRVWPNRDPIGIEGGINLYGYVGNRPVSAYDPHGLAWFWGDIDWDALSATSGQAIPLPTDEQQRAELEARGYRNDRMLDEEIGLSEDWQEGAQTAKTFRDEVGKGIAWQAVGFLGGKFLGRFFEDGVDAIQKWRKTRRVATLAAKEVATASPVGLADDLLKYASNVKPKAGLTDVFIHSDANGFAVLHNGNWVDLTHRDVANFITSKGITGDIRLISCEAGQAGLAQNLANKLGVSVEAATTKVGIYMYQVGEAMALNGGMWKTFVPGTRP